MKYGDEPVKKHKLDSLRVLGTVGEVRLMIKPYPVNNNFFPL